MPDTSFLDWPFFDDRHRALARDLEAWATTALGNGAHDDGNVDAACRALVASLGAGGWLRYAVPAAFGGALAEVDSRAVCLIRETLARHDALADFAFAMQGLGSAPILLAGDEALQRRYLPRVCEGAAIAAFALSEPEAGSDAAALATTARRDGSDWVLDGTKTWISNGGIADFSIVFARTGEAPGSRGISAFVVDAETPGSRIAERIELVAAHPLATLAFENCRIPASHRLGEGGDGFAIAMRSLDIFRASVAAAALGMARRALDESLARAAERVLFGKRLAEFQLTQASIAEMATGIDASALLTYRAAWVRDVQGARTTREAAMAKWNATETAQRIVDRAVQIHGALGVTRGHVVERLYREIRALRIYEGTSEVQQLIIARETLG
ncbi:acyl-CoA dehydrogenase [Vulcanimicrobium alpinum]|uniref:Acyl-CoA dehydrogenase n=1 Tax=Vulcanimicrobium alpinum TaxID=3016050 RepID=A0AAN1XZ83_UNVUL|nr:acyl-CoA dehydrogenase family protein [Vulcanimicrobium alpinum]BDE08117.1 acyl-CoA dehydrogenase [Vulcanimicrobium alpinum]